MDKIKKIFSVLSLLLFVFSCSASPYKVDYGSSLKVSEGRKIIKEKNEEMILVKRSIFVKSNTVFDGKNKVYVWSGPGECNQTEGQKPVFILYSNSILKNAYISNSPEGIHIKGNNILIDNIVNLGVCEDAISTRIRGEFVGLKIINSTFMNCEDKAIQMNKGVDVEIINNKFINCHIPIRVTVADNVKITNNYAHGCKIFVNSGPRVKNLNLGNNKENCKHRIQEAEDFSVSDLDYDIINEYKKKQ